MVHTGGCDGGTGFDPRGVRTVDPVRFIASRSDMGDRRARVHEEQMLVLNESRLDCVLAQS